MESVRSHILRGGVEGDRRYSYHVRLHLFFIRWRCCMVLEVLMERVSFFFVFGYQVCLLIIIMLLSVRIMGCKFT